MLKAFKLIPFLVIFFSFFFSTEKEIVIFIKPQNAFFLNLTNNTSFIQFYPFSLLRMIKFRERNQNMNLQFEERSC